ncbi:MAG: hypothetical protein NTY68_01020, partial [Candidatus Micrarchaeota archaeon]|nr:hypothetical protein [Candidatus Micrarchaeota archaeon]
MDDEKELAAKRKQHRIMNYLIINNIYSSSFPRQDNEGNIILSSFKDSSNIKISSASEIFYSDGKKNDKGEYNYIKIADVKFDRDRYPPIINVIENDIVNEIPVSKELKELKKMEESKIERELNGKAEEKLPIARASEIRMAEAPTAKASDIIQPKKKEPAIQQDISPTPKLREMPKEKDVAHAASP